MVLPNMSDGSNIDVDERAEIFRGYTEFIAGLLVAGQTPSQAVIQDMSVINSCMRDGIVVPPVESMEAEPIIMPGYNKFDTSETKLAACRTIGKLAAIRAQWQRFSSDDPQ